LLERHRKTTFKKEFFREDYPEADLYLLYRGKERIKTGGVLCLPCDEFLANLMPGKRIPT